MLKGVVFSFLFFTCGVAISWWEALAWQTYVPVMSLVAVTLQQISIGCHKLMAVLPGHDSCVQQFIRLIHHCFNCSLTRAVVWPVFCCISQQQELCLNLADVD